MPQPGMFDEFRREYERRQQLTKGLTHHHLYKARAWAMSRQFNLVISTLKNAE